jgi:hypothetical protein
MDYSNLRRSIFIITALLCWSESASAQLTLSATNGLWMPFLPDYEATSIVAPGGGTVLTENLLDDDQSGIGPMSGLTAQYDIAGTETYLEANAYVANVDSMNADLAVSDPGPAGTVWMPALSGTTFLSTANGQSVDFSLDSEVFHHAEYVGVHRRVQLENCLMTIGAGYRHLGFDQDFTLDGRYSSGFFGQYHEDLESDLDGALFTNGIQRRINGRWFKIESAIGVYRLDADYDGRTYFYDSGNNLIFSDQVLSEIGETVTSYDVTVKTECYFQGLRVLPMLAFTILSDLPYIVHPQTEINFGPPVGLATRSASMLRAGVEIVF